MNHRIILLVEDNPDDVALTLRTLRKNNIVNEVIVAHDGIEALDYLHGTLRYPGRDARDLPALVLLDLKLPKVDGLEVLRALRANERTHLLPVVILTSSRDETDAIRSNRPGCNAYVCKPVDFKQFAEALRELGLFWLVLNEEAAPPVRS